MAASAVVPRMDGLGRNARLSILRISPGAGRDGSAGDSSLGTHDTDGAPIPTQPQGEGAGRPPYVRASQSDPPEGARRLVTLRVEPRSLRDGPEAVGRMIARMMSEAPDALGVVIVGDPEEVRLFEREVLWRAVPIPVEQPVEAVRPTRP